MKRFFFISLMLVASMVMAQVYPKEILFLPWNVDSLGTVTCSLDPEGRVGPQNFRVNADTVSLLNQHKGVINIYTSRRMVGQLPVTPLAKDFLIHSANDYVCLADNGLMYYENQKLTARVNQTKPLPLIRKIVEKDREILAVNYDGSVSKISNRRLAKTASPGIATYDLRKESRSRATVTIRDADGNQSGEINLYFEESNLGSFNLIGADKFGRLFLDVDLIIQEVPLRVRREVWILNAEGNLVGKIKIPTHYYAMMWNDLRLDNDGRLYHMLSAEDGIHFMRWELSDKDADFFEGVYPEKFQPYLHYNDAIQAGPESLEKKSSVGSPTSTVTRSEALAIGDTYAVHEWNCTAANLTSTSGVIAPDGLTIITPPWIEAGENIRVPYKWGGFNTLTQFDDGLLAGKYAGDKYTDKSSGSSYAVGVDCSGFVSRCWKLSSHYSTREMDDAITIAYDSWDSLKAGDAIHRAGHVRLAVENLANGSILAVEAAGSSTDWRVNYRTYSYSALGDYDPRYYINMIGPSLPMTQPVLSTTLINISEASLSWSIGSTENINGIQIQYSEDGINWSPLLGDSLIAVTTTECNSDWSGGPVYLRLKSINNSGSAVVESLPSDTYGFYNNSSCSDRVLIVDGFDRASGSWGMPYHSFTQWMGENLADLGVSFETVANEAVIAGEVTLSDYKAVYWILGDESSVDEAFSAAEQTLISNYLQNGGQLFVSGSEIGWDLDSLGSSSDKAFYLNYLRADYVMDDADDYTVSGTSGGILSGLAFEYDDGSAGIYDEDYPDVIKPMSGATACLEYAGGVTAGVQYEGTFGSGTVAGKLVYLAFPWETITTSTNRKTVLKKISEWFGFNCTELVSEEPLLPEKASLSHGYPNPFNDRVTFNLTVPDDSEFEVGIYNSRGQLIRRLERPRSSGRYYSLIWNGRNDFGEPVASGCYFLRVLTDKQTLIQKVVFLK